MGVFIGGIDPRTTVTDSGNLQIEGARGVTALQVDGRTFVYVAGLLGDGLSSFQLRGDGTLVNPANIPDDATLELKGAVGFTSAVVGTTTYLYVNGFDDDGISAFRVNSDGSLTNVGNVDDPGIGSPLQLNGTRGQMSTVNVGATSYVVATGYDDDGVSVFRVNADGSLANTFNLDDGVSASLSLNNARDTASAVVGGNTFVFISGYNDDGVTAFQLDSAGTLTFRDSVFDSEGAALQLTGAYGVATTTVAGQTYVIVSGEEDDGLSVFRVDAAGQMTSVFNLEDNAALALDSPRGIEAFSLDGEQFIAVSAATDKALSIYHVGVGGILTEASKIFDSADLALDGTRYNDFVIVDGQPMLLATGQGDRGVSTFEIGGGDDVVRGSAVRDLLLGFDGADILRGAGGNDRLKGGRGGDDLYGGSGRDILMGDQGRDEFFFKRVNDSAPNAKRDVIDGFGGRDRIVVSKIDADTTLKGNQRFELDTGGAFEAGEIRANDTAKGTVLLFNVDDDAKAEMSLLLRDYDKPMNDGDFLF